MQTKANTNERSVAAAGYLDLWFEPCEFEPGQCDQCKKVAPLFFGDASYWDSREGTYLCAGCLDERREANAFYEAFIERAVAECDCEDGPCDGVLCGGSCDRSR